MHFEHSARVEDLLRRRLDAVDARIHPDEARRPRPGRTEIAGHGPGEPNA